MDKVSIVIPARNEPWLARTVEDIYQHATGDFEVIVVLDGYWPNPILPDHKGLTLIHPGQSVGMRAAVNLGVSLAKGKYVMKVDAHCSFAEGFDEIPKDGDEDWVIIPRRYSLDVETWEPKDKPPVDYEYFIWPKKFDPVSLHGFHWDERTAERLNDPMVDDTLTFQGSCWFMHKRHFERHQFLSNSGHNGLPQQEAEEIGLTTWYTGGRVVVNKHVSYSHFHKDERFYFIDREQARQCYQFSYNQMVIGQRDKFVQLINKFWPIPHWPKDWEEQLYGKS